MASLEDRNLAVDGHRDYSSSIPSRCTADSTLSTDIRMLSSINHWIRHLQGVAGPGAMPDIDGLPPAVLAGGGPDGVLWPAALAGADAAAVDAADRLLAARPGQSLSDIAGFRALEVWTECELSALHALARLVVTFSGTPGRVMPTEAQVRAHAARQQLLRDNPATTVYSRDGHDIFVGPLPERLAIELAQVRRVVDGLQQLVH
jgi:hypothetical protein